MVVREGRDPALRFEPEKQQKKLVFEKDWDSEALMLTYGKFISHEPSPVG